MSKNNKYVSVLTGITILLLVLFLTDKIPKELFLFLFGPISIAILIIGIIEIKGSLNR